MKSVADPRAHAIVRRAVIDGKLIRPSLCSRCGKPPAGRGRIEAHHPDYALPLDIEWLCPACHRQAPTGINGRQDLGVRNDFARRVELVRHEHGLSIREVSEGCGLSERTLIRLEHRVVRPYTKTIKALADFYKVSVTSLMDTKVSA